MRVTVFGLGHVGLVTAVMLAQYGHSVYGVDTDPDRLGYVRDGVCPFNEPGLAEALRRVRADDVLRVVASGVQAVAQSEVSLICVPTPVDAQGVLDLSAVYTVLDVIAEGLRLRAGYHVVALRSTVLPRYLKNMVVHINRRAGAEATWDFCTFPEFLREGTALADFQHPPYLVIGQEETRAGGYLLALLRQVAAQQVVTDCKTAMLLKYVSNAWHALKVTFANEVGDIAAQAGVDGRALMEMFALDTKLNLSSAYLRPGAPYGGSCLPKDLRALVAGVNASLYPILLDAVRKSNEERVRSVVNQVVGTGAQRVGVVGLSFKAGTDDVRESPWVTVMESLMHAGCELRAYDPDCGAHPLLVNDFAALCAWAECLVIGKPALLPGDVTLLPRHVVWGDIA